MPYYLSPPPSNPLVRFAAAVVAVIAAVGAFMLGLVAFTVVLGVGLVFALVFWLRLVWLRRQLRNRGPQPEAVFGAGSERRSQRESGETIEVEYTVVSREQD